MKEFDALLARLREQYEEAERQASLAETASDLTPADDVGALIRNERKKQNLTLHDLCDLADVSYSALSKLEKGNPSARLDILNGVLKALGLKLWVGSQTSTIKDDSLEN
jgi:ribosome-binding protein aMBF1 (putative translation factor)